jgi:hypothetical protein
MVKKFLDVNPHTIDDHAWWYEEGAGITFVVEFTDRAGNHIGTEQRTISWGSVRAALGRKDRANVTKRRRVGKTA